MQPVFFATGAEAAAGGRKRRRPPRHAGQVDHRHGEPVVRQGLRQPHVVGADRRRLLRAGRRHGPGPQSRLRRRRSTIWPASSPPRLRREVAVRRRSWRPKPYQRAQPPAARVRNEPPFAAQRAAAAAGRSAVRQPARRAGHASEPRLWRRPWRRHRRRRFGRGRAAGSSLSRLRLRPQRSAATKSPARFRRPWR